MLLLPTPFLSHQLAIVVAISAAAVMLDKTDCWTVGEREKMGERMCVQGNWICLLPTLLVFALPSSSSSTPFWIVVFFSFPPPPPHFHFLSSTYALWSPVSLSHSLFLQCKPVNTFSNFLVCSGHHHPLSPPPSPPPLCNTLVD